MQPQESFIFNSDGNNSNNSNILSDLNSSKSKMEIPVTFDKNSVKSATLSGYENPVLKNDAKYKENKRGEINENLNFIEKSETSLKNRLEMVPTEAIAEDIKSFASNFSTLTNLDSRHKMVVEGRSRLLKESEDLRAAIIADVSNLLVAKGLAVRMNALVSKYEKKIVELQEAKRLKLGDEIEIKNSLKAKLMKEVQGIRTNESQYKDLDKLNPDDIKRITKQVVSILNGEGSIN